MSVLAQFCKAVKLLLKPDEMVLSLLIFNVRLKRESAKMALGALSALEFQTVRGHVIHHL
jgi:hypothetical protein